MPVPPVGLAVSGDIWLRKGSVGNKLEGIFHTEFSKKIFFKYFVSLCQGLISLDLETGCPKLSIEKTREIIIYSDYNHRHVFIYLDTV